MRARLPLVAILIGACALRWWGIAFGLPHTLTRPDEEAVFSISLRVFQRHYDPEFFDWPSLYLYMASLGQILYFNVGRLLGWFTFEYDFLIAVNRNPAPAFLVARFVTLAMGVLGVWLIHRVAVTLFDRRVGWLAAALLAVAPLHVRDSHFGVPDITATTLVMASFLFAARYWRAPSPRHALLAALWAGLAASAKYNAGVIALSGLVAVLGVAPRGAAGGAVVPRLRLALLFGVVAAAGFLAGTPYALLNWSGFLEGLRRISTHLAEGHVALAGWAWGVHLRSSLWYGLRAPLFISAGAGLVLLAWRGGGGGRLAVIFPVVYFALIGSGQAAFARYIVPIVPWLCLAAAYAVVVAADWWRRHAALDERITIGALALLIALPATWTSVQSSRLLARPDTRQLAAAWVAREFPQGASVYQSGSVYGQLQWSAENGSPERFPSASFDVDAGFRAADGQERLPRLIVVQQHPLAYSALPPGLADALSHGWVKRAEFVAVPSFAGVVFDMDDAFYVPLSGLGRAERPGPNLAIYEARE